MSWDQLSSILQTAVSEARENATAPPTACPNDGEPLESGPNGVLHCKFDGWTWPRDVGA